MNKKLRILIADEDITLCEIMKKYLEKNVDVDILGTVYDGQEEIKLIKSLKPDVVITELNRKNGISGIDVIRECYKEFALNKTKVIVQTSGYSKEDLKNLEDFGIHHLLMKPFSLNRLKRKILEMEDTEGELMC